MAEREGPEDFEHLDSEFDAFDATTWDFQPAAAPWYRARSTMTALIATAGAAAAIVVSGVLLVFRGQADDVQRPVSVTSTAPAITPTATAPSSPPPTPKPPEPPPAEPPPQEPAATIDAAPPVRTSTQRPTKEPERNVIRTPITRSPMSVRPEPMFPRN